MAKPIKVVANPNKSLTKRIKPSFRGIFSVKNELFFENEEVKFHFNYGKRGKIKFCLITVQNRTFHIIFLKKNAGGSKKYDYETSFRFLKVTRN